MEVLNYKGSRIRTIFKGDKIYMSAGDMAKAIDMSNGRITRLYLAEGEMTTIELPTPGGIQPVRMIETMGIVKVLGRSKKPESSQFLQWFFDIVINRREEACLIR